MFRAYAALVALGVIWGTNFIFMKWATALITPSQTVFLRVLFGFIPLALIAWRSKVITREQLPYLPHFIVMSVLATSFYYYGFVAGTALLPSSIAGLLSGSIPIFTFVGAALFLPEEKPTKQMALGIAIGFAGITLSAQPWQGNTSISLIGVLWLLAGCLSVGASFVYARRFLSDLKLSPIALATWQIGIAVITLSVLVDFEGITNITRDTQALWGTIVGLGILGTGTAYLIYYFIIEKLGSVRAAGSTYIAPIVAVAIGAMMGENVSYIEISALILILGSVVLIQTGRSKTG